MEQLKSKILELNNGSEQSLKHICELLKREIDVFDWVGFYFVDKKSPNTLILGPFAGADTEHKRIEFGRGICGQAAVSLKTFIVQDVNKENNYLACSIDVKSEIVVPIIRNGKFIGELDIDSHTKHAIKDTHCELCEYIANIIKIPPKFL